jgi:hypothetical protein
MCNENIIDAVALYLEYGARFIQVSLHRIRTQYSLVKHLFFTP